MASIHLIVGYIGFGKTTLAQKLEQKLPAIRFSPDEFMCRLYGSNPPDAAFRVAFQKIDDLIWDLSQKAVNSGCNVVLDYGFWSKADRKKAYEKALHLTDNVVFHCLNCDMEIAKKRALKRSGQLHIDEACFDNFLPLYETMTAEEGYETFFYETAEK